MHKGISAAVVALSLAGCASTGTTPSSVTTSVNSVVSDIVGYAEAACAFQPDIASVLAIVTALYPGAAIASVPEQAVASTICGAVSTVTPVPVAASGRLRAAARASWRSCPCGWRTRAARQRSLTRATAR